MKSRTRIHFLTIACILALLAGARPVAADSSHARIVRLSLVQGEVRFTASSQNDPLSDQKAVWETAVVNLPIRQGYVLSTGHGRAEVEFENGATAYLDENAVLEFYDLSLNDGAKSTRLVLRQGTASFYVQPGREDVFTVTGGDFTAQAEGRASFRMDTYDDGSTIRVEKGHVTVLSKSQSIPLEKGQSLTARAGDESSLQVGKLSARDDFDKWVSDRSETVTTATNSALRYASSPYYTSGFGDLYTYGSWISYPGFGNCWRPFGVGFGWSPFSSGQWAFVRGIGWTWVSFEPWGWLPYHFGGWLFSPAYGWVWAPSGIGLGSGLQWRPATGVWVRSGPKVGLVPVHPLDARGKTPINITHGVIPVNRVGVGDAAQFRGDEGQKWKVLKSPPRDEMRSGLAPATSPVRVPRTVLAGDAGVRGVQTGRDSSIVFDPRERKFVNADTPGSRSGDAGKSVGDAKSAGANAERNSAPAGRAPVATPGNPAPGAAEKGGTRMSDARGGANPPRMTPPQAPPRTFTPPPAPRADSPRGDASRGDSPRGSTGSRSGGSGSSGTGSAPRSAPAPAPTPAPRSSPPPPPPRPH
jgi:hypothetical protein